MAAKRRNPTTADKVDRSAASTEEMARLAAEANFPNVAISLRNIAQRRRTGAARNRAYNAQ